MTKTEDCSPNDKTSFTFYIGNRSFLVEDSANLSDNEREALLGKKDEFVAALDKELYPSNLGTPDFCLPEPAPAPADSDSSASEEEACPFPGEAL